MQSSTDPCAIQLRIPAEERMMMIIRLTTAGVVARANLTLDAAEDVKLAAEEAAGCLIRFSGCESLCLDYRITGAEMTINLRAECRRSKPLEQGTDELNTVRFILESMVDRVQLSGQEFGLTGIELTKQLL